MSVNTCIIRISLLFKQFFHLSPRRSNEHIYIQNRCPNGVEIAPEMDVEFIFPVGGIDGLAIPDDAGHHAEDLGVGDAVFLAEIVITADHVVVRTDFQDTVEDVFVTTFIKDSIVTLTPACALFAYFDNIPALAEERHHTHANIGVNQIAVLFQQFFKGNILNSRFKNSGHFGSPIRAL